MGLYLQMSCPSRRRGSAAAATAISARSRCFVFLVEFDSIAGRPIRIGDRRYYANHVHHAFKEAVFESETCASARLHPAAGELT